MQMGEWKMPKIEYIELLDVLKEKGIEKANLKCCDPSASAFSVLRAQLRGEIQFSENAIWAGNSQHDEKCKSLLKTAKDNYVDLVLFPEYCISYKLLQEIVNDRRLWPEAMKLWCLPCEGIVTKDFEDFLKNLRRRKNIILIDSLWHHHVNKSKFVNAFFYCFQVFNEDGSGRLCLAPQFKTHHMSDPACKCETVGLTTGTKLFTINHRLITLLCADALNNDIYWQDFQQEKLSQGLLLLHPQLNTDPKHAVFCRIRQEMQTHIHPGICITCNWAENTSVTQAGSTKEHARITLSWSCIYHKRQDMTFDDWKKNRAESRQRNASYGLFGALMKKERMEVWFSPSNEQAIIVTIPNILSHQYAVTQIHGTTVNAQFFWSNENSCWQDQIYNYTLKERMEDPRISEELGQISNICNNLCECYRFPFEQQDKYLVDQFFALTLPEIEDSVMTIDEQENLADWSLLLDRSEYRSAIDNLHQFKSLTEILQQKKGIPSRLKKLKEPHCFCYELSSENSQRSNVNASNQTLLIVFAKSDVDAHRIAHYMVTKEFHNNHYAAEKFLGVVYIDIFKNEPHFLPEYSSEINQGDNAIMEGDITNGGN